MFVTRWEQSFENVSANQLAYQYTPFHCQPLCRKLKHSSSIMVISWENWQWIIILSMKTDLIRSRQFSVFSQTLCCHVYSSLHRCPSFSAPLFQSSIRFGTSASRKSSLFHYACCISYLYVTPRHNSKKAFSRSMWVLSHFDTHYLNRAYGIGCGCHERSDQSRSSQGYMAWCGCYERIDQSRSSQGYMAWCGCHEILIATLVH